MEFNYRIDKNNLVSHNIPEGYILSKYDIPNYGSIVKVGEYSFTQASIDAKTFEEMIQPKLLHSMLPIANDQVGFIMVYGFNVAPTPVCVVKMNDPNSSCSHYLLPIDSTQYFNGVHCHYRVTIPRDGRNVIKFFTDKNEMKAYSAKKYKEYEAALAKAGKI